MGNCDDKAICLALDMCSKSSWEPLYTLLRGSLIYTLPIIQIFIKEYASPPGKETVWQHPFLILNGSVQTTGIVQVTSTQDTVLQIFAFYQGKKLEKY